MEKNETQFAKITIIFPVATLGDLVETEKRLKEAISPVPEYRWDIQITERKGGGELVNPAAMSG